jgi:ATP-dependent DNA helicase DinG
VIFGLASFGEGVDLPGKLCSHVIIEKLPFAVPDSPIEATLSEYLESMGRNPFMEIAVPAVSIKLVQMMGRLIRTEDDYGLITLLDRRVLVKRYGQLLLNSLPEYRRQFDGITHAA